MLTIYEYKGTIDICYDNENMKHVSVEEFFGKELLKLTQQKQSIFVHNLSFWGPVICLTLHKAGFGDVAEEKFEDSKRAIGENEFSYVCSRSNGSFYNIKAGKCTFYEFLNLCSINDSDLMETFGGCMAQAMHRCVVQVQSFGTRASTISSAAFAVWKNGFPRNGFDNLFVSEEVFGDDFCTRDAYYGGLSYIKPGAELVDHKNGCVADCNSLYPFVMSTRPFPVGKGRYGKGEIPAYIRKSSCQTFFVRFRAAFDVKPGHMPFLRCRGDEYHNPEEVLETSDIISGGNRYSYVEYVDEETGEVTNKRIMITLTLYRADFELMFEQYDIHEIEYLDYVVYGQSTDVFKNYIAGFYEMKKNAKSKGERRIAKMFQNALSGRMGIKIERENVIFDDKSYDAMERHTVYSEKQRGKHTNHFMGDYIRDYAGGTVTGVVSGGSYPHIAAAITAEARAYMVPIIQQNWRIFDYTDTDSLHVDTLPEFIKGIKLSDEMGDFKIEHTFEKAVYYKSKVYVLYGDRITGKRVSVTTAGLPTEQKEILEQIMDYRMYGDISKIKQPECVDDYIWNHMIKEVTAGGETEYGLRKYDKHITVHIPRVVKKWTSYYPPKYIDSIERRAIDL